MFAKLKQKTLEDKQRTQGQKEPQEEKKVGQDGWALIKILKKSLVSIVVLGHGLNVIQRNRFV